MLSLAGSTAHAQEPTPREAEERGIAPHTWPAPALSGSTGLDLRTLEGGVVIMPSSGTGGTNAIAVFDAETGDLIDGAAIPFPEGGLGTTVQAIMNFEGDGLFVSSQTHHVVYEIGLDGEFRGVFAPHGGVDFDILHNIRGITLNPSGDRLWVTVANGPNEGAIAEFDQEGNYVGNFIEPAGSPMTSPWSISLRDQEFLISDSGADGIHRFQLDGTYVGLFNQTGLTFPQQVLELENGHVVTAVFSSSGPSGIHEFAADGTFIDLYTAVTGVRGVYELPNGNFLVSDAFGLHEITRQNELVRTIMTGQSRFLTFLSPSNLTFTPSTLQGEATIDTTAPGGFTMRNNTPQALAFEILDVPPFVNAISPGAGTLGPGASTGVSLTFDASGLPMGVHHGTILVQTDEAEDNLYEYPVVLTVVGIPECAIEPDPVAFGEVIVGSSSSLPVSVSNQGGGPCTLESAIIVGDEFSSDFPGPVTVAPDDTFTFEVAFTPSAPGPFTGTLTLVTGGDDLATELLGTGLPAPIATFDPPIDEGIQVALDSGESTTATLTIGNAGEGVLEFDFSGFRHAHIPALDEDLALDSFSVTSNAPPENTHTTTAQGGIQTQGQVVGFTFEGTVTGVGGTGTWASDMSLTITSPDGQSFSVGGFGTSFPPWGFQGFGSTNDGTYTSTHIGVFEDALDTGEWQFIFVKHFGTASTMNWADVTITLHKGQMPFVTGVDPASGSVAPGTSTDVTVTIGASGLNEGTYQSFLHIGTNEPASLPGWLSENELEQLPPERRALLKTMPVRQNTEYLYPVTLHVGGDAGCVIAPDPIAFGEVMVGFDATLDATLFNLGTAACVFTGVAIDKNHFSTDLEPVSLAPGQSAGFTVAFAPASVGEITGTLTLEGELAVTAQLSGTGIAPPEAAVNPTALDFVVAQNGTASASVTLSNEAAAGAADLDFSVSIGAVSPDRSEAHLRRADTAAMGGQPVRPGGAVRPGRDGPSGGVEAATRALVAAGIEPIGGAPPLPVIPPADQGHPIDHDWHEGFEDITLLPAAGWAMQNNSQPLGLTGWRQGSPNVFPAHAGPVNSYIRANFENVAGAGEISNWLMTPEIVLENGTELRFWTRTTEQFQNYSDRLEVRLSTAGGSTNVGAMATSVGDFDELLLSINPDLLPNVYPEEWTEYVIVLDGIPSGTTGRFAFRYWVTNAGPHGDFGDYIGIDEVSLTYTGPTMVSVVPAQGSVSAASSQDLTVSINAEGAEEGTYNFELLIQTNDPENALLTVSVSVQVTEQVPAQAGVDPLSLQFELSPADLPSAWQVVTLSNLASHGAADLQFELSFGDGSDAERGAAQAAASLYMAPARVADPAAPAQEPDARVQLGSEAGLEGRVYRPRAITDPSGMLGVEPASGIVAPGEALEIMVTAYCDDDDDFGTYTFDLLVHTNAPDNPVIVVQIEIVVSETIAAGGNPASNVFDLEPNHPNPFSDRTTIAYSLAEASHVLLIVYDLSGRRVATLVDAEQAAGRHSATWDASGLAAGIYFYRIRAGEFTGTMRALVVR